MPKLVKCDQCGVDVSSASVEVDRLELNKVRIPLDGGFIHDVLIHQPVERDACFCSIYCLAAWVDENHPDALKHYRELQEAAEVRRASVKPPPPRRGEA